jgi:hypothetical protein
MAIENGELKSFKLSQGAQIDRESQEILSFCKNNWSFCLQFNILCVPSHAKL